MLDLTESWYCPNCHLEETIPRVANPHTRFHTCPKLHMLTAPMVPAGTRARVEQRDREDYVRDELVTRDDRGRPVMSIVTTRDDGTDAVVFAPTATGEIGQ